MKCYWFQKLNVVEMLIRKRLSILYEGKNKQFLMVTKDFGRNRVKKMQQKGHLLLTKEKSEKKMQKRYNFILFFINGTKITQLLITIKAKKSLVCNVIGFK